VPQEPPRRGEPPRRFFRERDWEFIVKRSLLVLVCGPTGGLVGAASVEAESGNTWWPWLLAGVLWFILAGSASVAIWLHMIRRGVW